MPDLERSKNDAAPIPLGTDIVNKTLYNPSISGKQRFVNPLPAEKLPERAAIILALMNDRDGWGGKRLSDASGIAVSRVDYWLRWLRREGLISRSLPRHTGKRGRPEVRYYKQFPACQAFTDRAINRGEYIPERLKPETLKPALNQRKQIDSPLQAASPLDSEQTINLDMEIPSARERNQIAESNRAVPSIYPEKKKENTELINDAASAKREIANRIIEAFDALREEHRGEGQVTQRFYAVRHVSNWIDQGLTETDILDRLQWFWKRENESGISRAWPLFFSVFDLMGDELAVATADKKAEEVKAARQAAAAERRMAEEHEQERIFNLARRIRLGQIEAEEVDAADFARILEHGYLNPGPELDKLRKPAETVHDRDTARMRELGLLAPDDLFARRNDD